MNQYIPKREMTAKERREIKKLAVDHCANYDSEYGCLPLECDCYMLGKWYTGAFCKYFEQAVLPLNPTLVESLNSTGVATKPCKTCGKEFPVNRRQAYCSEECELAGRRKDTANRVRKHRNP